MHKRLNNGLHKVIFLVLFVLVVIAITRLVIYKNSNHGIEFNCNGQAKSLIISPYVILMRDIIFNIKLNRDSTGDINLNGVVTIGEKKFTLSQKISFKYSIGERNTILITVLGDLKNKMDNAPQEALPYFMKDFFTLNKISRNNYMIYENNGNPFLACKGSN